MHPQKPQHITISLIHYDRSSSWHLQQLFCIKWRGSLRRQLQKKLILPTFRLDAPILFKVTIQSKCWQDKFLVQLSTKRTASFYDYRSNWELSTFTTVLQLFQSIELDPQASVHSVELCTQGAVRKRRFQLLPPASLPPALLARAPARSQSKFAI